MSDANVLQALDDQQSLSYKRASLNNILVYGRVRCLIKRPSFIGSGVKETNGYFALVDAYALKCLGEDYFRESSSYDVNSIYFTKGSILIYIDDKSFVGKDVKVFGKSKSYGATIRRQDSKNKGEGISALMFGSPIREGGKSVYPLVPNVLVEMNTRDPEAKGTILEDFLVSIAANKGEIPYPETLDAIIPYSGVIDYTVIDYADVASIQKGSADKENSNQEKVAVLDTAIIETNSRNSDNNVMPDVSNVSKDGRVDVSKIDMHLTFHLDGKERPEYFDSFKEDLENNAKLRATFVKESVSELSSVYRKSDRLNYDEIVVSFISKIASNPQRKLGGYATVRVKKYLDAFIEGCGDVLKSDIQSADMQAFTIKGVEELKTAVYTDSSVLYGDSGNDKIDKLPILNDVLSFFVNVIGTCTGIGYSTLRGNYNYAVKALGIDKDLWLFMLLKYPYSLGMLSVGLSLVDCDIIYFSVGRLFVTKDDYDLNNRFRTYLSMLDTLNNCCDGKFSRIMARGSGTNTFIKINDYKTADSYYSDNALKYLQSTRFIAGNDIKELLEVLLNIRLSMDRESIDIITNKNWFNKDCFDTLCSNGIINTLDDYCALEGKIEQEFMIYEVFEKMGKLSTGITDDVIEEVISEFEKNRGFKLEGLQREGIKLCKYRAGVLSGCAGSGKTTTSDCMTEVLKTLAYDGDEIKIVYCTPTGKACRRLAEVVHSTVKTIHSQFNVGLGGSSYLQGAYKAKKKGNDSNKGGKTIYILDEMAMCNTELMYNIARNILEEDIIYFLGDVKQLPPIGGGCPFKILMDILPCVELGVSKRAAEGSLVNYNTSLINFMSDPYCVELAYDDKTFISRHCADESIVSTVRSVFSGFMDGSLNGVKYLEDDIQVISGYQSKAKLSSTSRLNRPLQELLRSNDKILYYKEVRKNGEENEPFYLNDRVIYINRNSYDICRYIYENDQFNKVITFGCVNGEMGKLVGVLKASDVKFNMNVDVDSIVAGEGYYKVSEEELKQMKERYEGKKDDLRNDASYNNDNDYFVVIKVYDTDLRRDVLALLRGRGHYAGSDFCLSGIDLNNLALAYALTCHKMQGSQSKVVVAVFESTGSADFINRNMINTIITRSQGIVCCVGSVEGADSMLNRGRKVVSKTDCKDMLSVMSGRIEWLG